MLRDKLKVFFKLFLSNLLGQLVAFLLYPYISRYYSPEDFSKFGYVVSLTMFLSVFATGQFHAAILNARSEEEVSDLLGLSFSFTFLFSFLTLIFLLITNQDLLIVPLYLILYSMFDIQRMFFLLKKKFNSSAFAQIFFRIFGNGSKLFPSAIDLKSYGLILTEIFSLALVVLIGIKNDVFKFRFKFKTIKKYYNFPIYQSVGMALNIVTNDFPILFWINKFPESKIGYFVMGQKLIVTPVLMLSNALQGANIHHLMNSTQPQKSLTKTYFSVFLLGICGIILYLIWGEDLLFWLLGEKWRGGKDTFRILVFLIATKIGFSLPHSIFILRFRTKIPLLIRIFQLSLLFILQYLNFNFEEALKIYIIIDIFIDLIMFYTAYRSIRAPFKFNENPT
jgi:O-antigen/teichoic acid export membrane protein